MTGRVVDSFTNITTVKLFSHAGREAFMPERAWKVSGNCASADATGDQVSVRCLLQQRLPGVCRIRSGHLALAWICGVRWFNCHFDCAVPAHQRDVTMDHVEVSGLFENIGVVHDGMT